MNSAEESKKIKIMKNHQNQRKKQDTVNPIKTQ
jgi:hypothetical protein